jgi:hypothetical protein
LSNNQKAQSSRTCLDRGDGISHESILFFYKGNNYFW